MCLYLVRIIVEMKNRRFLTVAFIACMLAAMSPAHTASAQSIYADVNGDGQADISDVTSLISFLLKHTGSGSGIVGLDRGCISAKDYGAVGDGIVDDTEALETAFADAARMHVSLYIPAGTYMIRRPLALKSGMEVYGDGAATVIRKKAAVWHKLTAVLTVDTHVATLDAIDGYEVGDAMYVSDSYANVTNGSGAARECSYGVITAIDSVNKRVTFKSSLNHVAGHSGAVKNHSVDCVLSTSYSIFRSWSKDECIGVYIHDICLDGNRQTNEPMSWCNGCIHFDPYSTSTRLNVAYNSHSYNHIIANCTILNSSFDGISDQSEGGLYVKDCTIKNSAMHGVHMGTVFTNALIAGNTMTGNTVRGAGVFFCQDVTNVIVDDNTISSFNHGCSDEEYGTAGTYNIIRNNKFSNITSYVFDFLMATSGVRGGSMLITKNKVTGLKAAMFAGKNLDDVVITNNTVSSVSTSSLTEVIKISSSKDVIIVGNTLPSGASVSQPVNATNVTNLIQTSNSWN